MEIPIEILSEKKYREYQQLYEIKNGTISNDGRKIGPMSMDAVKEIAHMPRYLYCTAVRLLW